MKIKGSIALVTGASSGIGEATAQRLAMAGYKVYGTSRRGVQSGQRSFAMLPLDVTSAESVEAAVRDLIRLEGRIDLLVNNAGFGVAPAGAEESSIEQAKAIFETNFFGLIRMTRAVVPHMRRQGNGRIINIGSVLGFLPIVIRKNSSRLRVDFSSPSSLTRPNPNPCLELFFGRRDTVESAIR
jgi:NAD(P)-dependent dehydrogenase (short-subunit alcohol dehydrogenase family)